MKALPEKHRKQVARKILALETDPYPNDRRGMTDYPGVYRLDSGEYRIGFTEEKNATTHEITIVLVDRRNDDVFYRNIKRRLGM